MKNIFISFILFMPFALAAQTSGTCQGTIKLSFIYDAAGNRIQRKLVCDNNSSTVRAGTHYTKEFEVYPNPSSGLFSLFIPIDYGENTTISVWDIHGKLLNTFEANGQLEQVDLRGNPPGNYLIRIRSEDGSIQESKVVVKN